MSSVTLAATVSEPPRVPRGTRVVTIIVGPSKERLVVHKDLVVASSEFLRGAFLGKFAKGTKGELKLPDTQTATAGCKRG